MFLDESVSTVSEIIRDDARVACGHTEERHPFEYLAEGQDFIPAPCGCCRGSGWFVSSWDTWERCPCGANAGSESPDTVAYEEAQQEAHEAYLATLSDPERFKVEANDYFDQAFYAIHGPFKRGRA